MARQLAKRRFVRRPGLLQAAEVLCCDYSHLRRVIIGERQSKTLIEKFHALATQPQNATVISPPSTTTLTPPVKK